VQELTPRQVVAHLDRFVVGQADAKRAVAVAIRNRVRRQRLDTAMARDVLPKNIILAGPTGVGKTEIARRMAEMLGAPFLKVEATKYTEVGYYGRDVETIARDLVEVSMSLVTEEEKQRVKDQAKERAESAILDALVVESEPDWDVEDAVESPVSREEWQRRLRAGELEDKRITLNVEERVNTSMDVFCARGARSRRWVPSRCSTRTP
jgi:ATP-dependent HslUV protease ATP-binding subunit HslU